MNMRNDCSEPRKLDMYGIQAHSEDYAEAYCHIHSHRVFT
jgi:hypothetical protein